MSERAKQTHTRYIETPHYFDGFTDGVNQVVHQARTKTLLHTATDIGASFDDVILENRPAQDPDMAEGDEEAVPYRDYDLIAIRLGHDALSVTMEHLHSKDGRDHTATTGVNSETIVVQTTTSVKGGTEIHSQKVESFRTIGPRIYPVENITGSPERAKEVTARLIHALAAVGIFVEMTPEQKEIPQDSEETEGISVLVRG